MSATSPDLDKLKAAMAKLNSDETIAPIALMAEICAEVPALMDELERLQKQIERLYVSMWPEYTKMLTSAMTTDGMCIAVLPIGQLLEKNAEIERLRGEVAATLRPMSEAPRDGSDFLGYTEERGKLYPEILWSSNGILILNEDGEGVDIKKYVGWHPLPEVKL